MSEIGGHALREMSRWPQAHPGVATAVRGKGLLLLVEFRDEATAGRVTAECLSRRVFVRQTQGNAIRVFPALTIERGAMMEGLAVLEQVIALAAR